MASPFLSAARGNTFGLRCLSATLSPSFSRLGMALLWIPFDDKQLSSPTKKKILTLITISTTSTSVNNHHFHYCHDHHESAFTLFQERTTDRTTLFFVASNHRQNTTPRAQLARLHKLRRSHHTNTRYIAPASG
jgi:hypothetical protein